MGAFLDKPITDKANGQGEGNGLTYGFSSMQGWRMTMEDAHTVTPFVPGMDKCSFYGVYDGHCGPTIAKYSSENILPEILKHNSVVEMMNSDKEVDPNVISKAMIENFVVLDDHMRTIPPWKNGEDHSGTTAICAFITPTEIICANCGDSRAVFSNKGELRMCTVDHKPYNEVERERIEKAGGSVMMQRVNGSLAVSRALGDYEYKCTDDMPSVAQQVSPEPETYIVKRDESDEFLIIACDGIWDVMTNQESIDFVSNQLQIYENKSEICDNLIEECFNRGSRDNMSVVLVTFPGAPKINEEARAKAEQEKQRIADITERMDAKIKELYSQSNMITVSQVTVQIDTMFGDDVMDFKTRRRVIENSLQELRDNDTSRPQQEITT